MSVPGTCSPGSLAELVSSKLSEKLFLQRGGVQVKTLTPGLHTYSTQYVLLYINKPQGFVSIIFSLLCNVYTG